MNRRSFLPGQDWLYFKIYCGFNTGDEIISQVIYPFSTQMVDTKVALKWFFIRYSDPHYHIRYRIRLTDSSSSSKVINEFSNLLKTLFDQGFVWNVKLDTYNRELERYGEHTIDLCEDLFMYDSCMVAQSIPLLQEFENVNEMRWVWGFLMLDSSLNDLGKNLDEKMELISYCREAYSQEYGYNDRMKIDFDAKFRNNRGKLTNAISGTLFSAKFQDLIHAKSSAVKPIIDEIFAILPADREKQLVTSLNHMMVNRLFRTKQRLNEFVLYHLLYRYHVSDIAKKKYSAKNSIASQV